MGNEGYRSQDNERPDKHAARRSMAMTHRQSQTQDLCQNQGLEADRSNTPNNVSR